MKIRVMRMESHWYSYSFDVFFFPHLHIVKSLSLFLHLNERRKEKKRTQKEDGQIGFIKRIICSIPTHIQYQGGKKAKKKNGLA